MFDNFNTSFEPIVTQLRPDSTFLTATAKQLGVKPHCHIVPAGELYPSVDEMNARMVGDIARAVCPEDGE